MERRRIYGIAILCTLIGAVIGDAIPPPRTYRVSLVAKRDRLVANSIQTVAGGVIGAVIGVAIDLALHGLPKRHEWRFSVTMLLFSLVTFAILIKGVISFLQILRLEP